jgi:hypothetical protein
MEVLTKCGEFLRVECHQNIKYNLSTMLRRAKVGKNGNNNLVDLSARKRLDE